MSLESYAFAYRDQSHFSVLPVRPGSKIPDLIKWDKEEKLQERHASDDEIKSWFKKWPAANLGIVTGAISGVSIIDVDTKKFPDAERALFDVIPDTLVTIAENTPGGKHYFFKYDPRVVSNASKCIQGVDTKSDGGMIVVAPSVRPDGKYRWIPGCRPTEIGIDNIPPFPETYLAICKEKSVKSETKSVIDETPMFVDGRRDKDLFFTACSLLRGNMPLSAITQVMTALVRSWGETDPKWIQDKVQSAIAQMEKEIDRTVDIKGWCINQDQQFRIESCFRELQLTTPQQMAIARQVIKEIKGQGIIEPGNTGYYRVIDRSVKYLIPKEEHPLNLKWPLHVDDITNVCPHDVAVVAGVTGAGKTAFSLNLAELNMDIMPVRYIASELTGGDLYRKLKHMPKLAAEVNKRVEFIERLHAPWELVLPDALNIIDYLEIHKDFYAIGEFLLKCFERLNSGICLICLQKNQGTEMGRGGQATMQKASLYINLEMYEAQIKKARWWRDPYFNPRDRKVAYEIEHGIIMKNKDIWR